MIKQRFSASSPAPVSNWHLEITIQAAYAKKVNQIQLAFAGAAALSRLQIRLLIIQFPEEITSTLDAKWPLN